MKTKLFTFGILSVMLLWSCEKEPTTSNENQINESSNTKYAKALIVNGKTLNKVECECDWLVRIDTLDYYPINLPDEFKEDNYNVLITYKMEGTRIICGTKTLASIELLDISMDSSFSCKPIMVLPYIMTDKDTLFQNDSYSILSAEMNGSCFEITVSYSGGCNKHDFTLGFMPSFCGTPPVPPTTLILFHNAHNDICEAWITETLSFDISSLTTNEFYFNDVLYSITKPTECNDFVKQKIDELSKVAVRNPPASIWEWEIIGLMPPMPLKYYYIPAYCCDIMSELYDSNCNLICHPDGGITGRGDGNCPDFPDEFIKKTLIWQDERSNEKCIDKDRIQLGRPCIELYSPVCGCDGVTYSNTCVAEANGVLSWTEGECNTYNECIDKNKIDSTKSCYMLYAPVCGCDGVTYSNDCFAEANGVLSWTEGECETIINNRQ